MKLVSLPNGASPRQAIACVQAGEVFLMYADAEHTKQVAQVCRDEQAYYVAGPRFYASGISIDQLHEAGAIAHYNSVTADDRGHIYRVDTPEQAIDKLQQLFKLNKF